MADEQTGNETPNTGINSNAAAPKNPAMAKLPFQILVQYVKDISFESPMAPDIFKNPRKMRPHFDIDVFTKPLGGTDVEVNVKVEIKGLVLPIEGEPNKGKEEFAYFAELTQSTVVRINEVPKEAIASLLMVEVPTLTYPFLRATALNLIREGGFPPPQLPIINFLALAKNKAEFAAAEEKKGK